MSSNRPFNIAHSNNDVAISALKKIKLESCSITVDMRVESFVWLSQFEDKIIIKHGVLPREAEEVLLNRPKIRMAERGKVPGENLYKALGQSYDGRYLLVIFVYKPQDRAALVISARDMDRKERKHYGKK